MDSELHRWLGFHKYVKSRQPIWREHVSLTSENSLMLIPSQSPASCDNHCSCLHYQPAIQRSALWNCTDPQSMQSLSGFPHSAHSEIHPHCCVYWGVIQLPGSLVILPLTDISVGSSTWLLSIKLLQALFHKLCGHIF